MTNWMITAIGFYAGGGYLLVHKRHDEHKWTEAAALFLVPGTLIVCLDKASRSPGHFMTVTLLSLFGVMGVTGLCAHADRYLREHQRFGRRLDGEAISSAAVVLAFSFIGFGFAYIQVLAWVWPNRTENWLDFAAFWVIWGGLLSSGLSIRRWRLQHSQTPQTQAIR